MRVIIVRNDKESPRKCSLTPVRDRADLEFHRHSRDRVIDVGEATLLHPEGEVLGPEDVARPLLLVDASWRRLPAVLRDLRGTFALRSLPRGWRTAYPRRSSTFEDPDAGLASIEALFCALAVLGRRDDTLLEGYRWKQSFLDLNRELLAVLPFR